MRVITLERETSVAALADRLYANLTPETRRTAEAVLLKANPHLARADGFKPGTVVRLPELPEARLKPKAANKDPRDELIDGLGAAVADYRTRLAAGLEAEKKAIDTQNELLKQREVAALLKNVAGAAELAKALTDALKQTEKSLPEEKKRQDEAFARIAKDLAALQEASAPRQAP